MRLLIVLAVVGFLVHHGVLPTPQPLREAASAAVEWRDEQIAALRCRAAVMAALTAADDEALLRRLEASCGDRRHPARATV